MKRKNTKKLLLDETNKKMKKHTFNKLLIAISLFGILVLINLNGISNPTNQSEKANKEVPLPAQSDYPASLRGINSPPLSDSSTELSKPLDVDKWVSRYNGTCIKSPESVPEWQERAPYFIIIGMQKGGSKAIQSYLAQHPFYVHQTDKNGVQKMDKVNGNEPHFFDRVEGDPERFKPQIQTSDEGYDQKLNREVYATKFVSRKELILEDKRRFVFDDSPRYMLFSDRVPDAMLCVAPWAKLIALVRNPVDRAISLFNHMSMPHGVYQNPEPLDWDDFLGTDLKLLRDAGVLRNWTTQAEFDDFSGSADEARAWEEYLQNYEREKIDFPIGRGLYAIMLDQFYAALDRAGRPRSDLLVIQSEEMGKNTQAVYDRTLEFLNLDPHTLADSKPVHPTVPANPIPEHWRQTLTEIYEPYNRRLYKQLNWDPVWS